MKSLELKTYGDKVLRTRSKEVEEFGEELAPFIDEMIETMIVEGGVGLAAPQIGISKRITVINPDPDDEGTLIKMINPRIVGMSKDGETMEEGCLSVPGIRGEVIRSKWVEVVYQDETGKEHRLKAEGLLARIIQHELDHLNGILFLDHLSIAKRLLLKSKLRSLKTRSDRET